MRAHRLILLIVSLLLSIETLAGTVFKATTTLTAQTSNNTSAAGTFATQTNGNLGAGNISKMPMRSLLYPGSTARIYVHLMPWFGFGDHMDVGYTSNDPVQVQKQVADMASRGMDGAIVDWYGQGTLTHEFSFYDQAVQELKQDAEAQVNFSFALMDDAGSLKACAATSGCDVTQTLINDLTYAYNNYENSPAYLHYNNQPVVYFFGQEAYALDWARVRASVPGNPLFIFRNSGGFGYAQSNGGFSWIAPETVSPADPMALLYLDGFDKTALSSSSYSTESGYKGFNDSLASWGTGRLIQQQCGQTWLKSVAESGKYYSTSQQMLGIQLVTWNDYEEGTEIESGIDNCVTVSAVVTRTVVHWTITGQANTVDHFAVYLSQDGENLMWLVDEPASTSSADLSPWQLSSGNYTVYVQAIGKPSMTNKMSAGAPMAISNPPIVFTIAPAPGLFWLGGGASAHVPDQRVTSPGIDLGRSTKSASRAAGGISSTANGYAANATLVESQGTPFAQAPLEDVKPRSVTIASPTPGTVSGSSVQVIGSASSGYQVVATQVYLDGVLKYETTTDSVNTSLALSAGTHEICIQGSDSSGATFKAFVTVTR